MIFFLLAISKLFAILLNTPVVHYQVHSAQSDVQYCLPEVSVPINLILIFRFETEDRVIAAIVQAVATHFAISSVHFDNRDQVFDYFHD